MQLLSNLSLCWDNPTLNYDQSNSPSPRVQRNHIMYSVWNRCVLCTQLHFWQCEDWSICNRVVMEYMLIQCLCFKFRKKSTTYPAPGGIYFHQFYRKGIQLGSVAVIFFQLCFLTCAPISTTLRWLSKDSNQTTVIYLIHFMSKCVSRSTIWKKTVLERGFRRSRLLRKF